MTAKIRILNRHTCMHQYIIVIHLEDKFWYFSLRIFRKYLRCILWLKAGIEKDNLLIALEPETASLFCKHLPIEKMVASERGYDVFSPGSTYVVLDAGGKLIFILLNLDPLSFLFIG